MPETVAAPKRAGVERLGGEVVLAGRTSQDRYEKAMELAEQRGLAVVPPYDQPAIIAGQGTIGLEIVEDCPEVRTVVVPVGGGGLSAGVATAIKVLRPNAHVITVEPEGAAKFARSFAEHRRVVLEKTGSLADGLITLSVGALPLAVLQAHGDRVRGVVLVDDDSIREAVHYLWQYHRLKVEPSGAATTAAVRSGAIAPSGPTVLVVSGGNVDPALLED